ncbi:pentachlorophenol monooxygenase [Streptomyces gilvosporeus]|uniref:Pentachlorophenol monooxygenase n=1 Tax=Streptomyces gilvosporeus TaxID=553510 RepID=A0A1V0TWC3_9ACTN|nr:pentachlorophenol monooxygenase [Streptomyces gilvosporeus]
MESVTTAVSATSAVTATGATSATAATAGVTPPTVDVLISGAGPTGLALAIDLTRRGVSALVVERQERLSPGGRGTGLQPRTQEVYEDLGVLEAIQAAGGDYPPVAMWEDGRIASRHQLIERVDPTPSAPYSNVLMVPQWRNVEVLHARLQSLGGNVLFGTELTAFDQDSETVRAHLTLPDGGTRTVVSRYLVAADGGRSTVRRGLGIGMSGPELEEGAAVLADIRVDGLDRDHWHRWMPPGGGFAMMLPLARTDLFQSFIAVPPESTPETSPDAVRALIAAHTHLTADQIREVRWSSVFRPRVGMVDRFRVGRIFLAGDAAHVHTPAGGQGLNTSVQDAYNLGWKLAQVLRHGAPDTLLDTYESERRPIAARILDTSTRLFRSRSMRRGRDLHQLDIGYRESPLTQELRPDVPEDELRAGDRAPDAPCTTTDGRPFRLFEAYRGAHFTVLALGAYVELAPLDGELVRVYRVGGSKADLLDSEGYIGDAYGSHPGIFLIRPDGYVAVATSAEKATECVNEALSAYFGTEATQLVH